jgi:type II secretory pathway pseudopilin PulG
MKTKDSSLFRSLPQNAAFTLLELVVIVVIVALLATLPLAATSTTKNQVSIAQCASNLRQFGQAMQILATDNSDNLPSNSAGFWAWDINWATGDALTNYASFKVFYCPGTAPRFTDADYLALFNFAPPNLRVLGYATTLPGTPTVALTNWNPTLMPSSSLNTGPALAAQRVFLADATISATGNDYNLRYSYNWTQIPGGYPKNHLSPHLRGIVPAGGNQTMLDGHVEWRAFDDMRPRTSSGTAPVFWW